MKFEKNSETAFVVSLKRNTGNKVPKLCKIIGEVHFDPDEAFTQCDKINLQLDTSGKNKTFSVAEIEVRFVQSFESKAEFEKEF
jgi:hypothetical protein